MFESQIECGQSGWCVTQSINLCDTSRQNKVVNNVFHTPRWQKCRYTWPQAWYSGCWTLRASSRSTVFIIEEGSVSAFFFKTVR